MNIQEEIKQNLIEHRNYFFTHETKVVDFRIEQLKKLKRAIRKYENNLYDALWKDLRKSKFEAYGTEIGIVLDEITQHLKNIKSWAATKKVKTPVFHYKSDSYIHYEPFGVTLIIAPWNYPFQLLINPLVAAISTGNVAMLKTSPYTPETARVMAEMLEETFDKKYIGIYHGGREVNQYLLEEKFDFIFFTGSPMLGKIVMQKAANYLTPVALELGGKSPAIIDSDANLELAARRLMWGKLVNAGQTCIAPDYLFVHSQVKDKVLELMKENIHKFFGDDPQKSPDFPRIVNQANVERLQQLMKSGTVYDGGQIDMDDKYVAPTLLTGVKTDSPIMQEEIFGPILPIMEFSNIDEVVNYVNEHPKPLAMYYFSESNSRQKDLLNRTSSGGGCINDTLMHIANHNLPFGGVGNSGMGRYHGKYGFESFSNIRSIIKKSTLLDVPVRYAPYEDKIGMIKMLIN
jgi:aldehyde dehydrogenase (NAD+)